jgi:diguanylate cyclase (GGDEF)-like protein
MEELEHTWIEYLEKLDIAFQPIVSMHSGKLYGVEALLRGVEEIGFGTIAEFFDRAYMKNVLYTFDLALREKVIRKFTHLNNYSNIKLFINLDNRLLEMPDFASGNTAKLLKKHGLHKEMICFEISERHEISNPLLFEEILTHYREENYSIAIDDFGIGVSGYQMLYRSTPDIIKIDRFFIESICKDVKKKILVRSIVQLATQLGVTVIAEGVESEKEMLVCKELGCHLVQGYFVQRPTLECEAIQSEYKHVKIASKRDRRSPSNKKQIKAYIEQIEPICAEEKMEHVLERFKTSHYTALPVITKDRVPLGTLNEEQMKGLVSSPYGRAILLNESSGESKVKKYVQKCAMVDIHTGMEQIVECFSNYKEAKGIIITKNMEYYGFLSASNIISIINERNLASAQDQNPLTRMPGNHQIDHYINNAISRESSTLLVYFDLNHFKAYNDTYGFRNGDRVIQVFADLMIKEFPPECFKGHIGGDDFFTGLKLEERSFEQALADVRKVQKCFSEEVRALYEHSDLERGYIVAKDREGKERSFELLSVSAVAVQLHTRSRHRAIDLIHKHFASEKKTAKMAPEYLNISSLL